MKARTGTVGAGAAAKKTKKPGAARSTTWVEAAVAALREEVSALRQDVARQTEAITRSRLDEIPRAEDFQPLADHLYAFAESAPRLLAELEGVQKAASRVETTAESLNETADTLTATLASWNESLLHLPRAEDYEPLVGPLREFTRVSPVLAETLASVVKAVTPLPKLIAPLLAGSSAGASIDVAGVAERVVAARDAIRTALASLPRDPEYAAAAAHLRELATVSPSLLEWLQQLPAISMPLSESVAALQEAVRELEYAEAGLRRLTSAPASRHL
jgi:hypothetical protein